MDQQPSILSPGDHLCCVFDDEAQRRELFARLVCEGLRRVEKVCCLGGPEELSGLIDGVTTLPGQFACRSLSDSSPLLEWIEQQAVEALSGGCLGLRVIGELYRSAGLPPGGVTALEQRLGDLCEGHYVAAACLVDSRLGRAALAEALLSHPRLAAGETSRANPFYLPPGPAPRAALAHSLETAELPASELRLRLAAEVFRRQQAEQALEGARRQLRESEARLASGITARRQSEARLRKHEAQFRSLVENSPVGISLTNEEGAVIEWNATAQEIYQIPPERVLGRPIWDVRFDTLPAEQRSPALYAQLKESIQAFFRTGQAPWLHQYEGRTVVWPNGEVRYVQRIRFPIRTEYGFMLASIMHDVTGERKTELELEQYRQRLEAMVEQRTIELQQQVREREQVEAVLRESEGRYRALVNQSPLSILVEQAGHYIFANPTIVQRLGYDSAYELIGRAAADITNPGGSLPVSPRQSLVGSQQAIQAYFRKDGSVYFAEVTSMPIFYQGRPAMLIIGQDVTERLQYEQRLEASLAEKEVMLREIHHRVKNNLNVIIALIDLQKAGQSDPQVLQVFKELQTRAYTMALVHESLYRAPNLAHVDFANYLRTLVSHLYSAYGPPAAGSGSFVEMCVEVHDVSLNIETAIPCGLIVNELVTNALKYGFPKGALTHAAPGCQVAVRLDSQPAAGGSQLVLTVQDNGVGLPPGFEWRSTQTLGLQLVQILARQLGGTIELESGQGATWKLTFLERKVHTAV